MKRYLKNWSPLRALRLAIGIVILVQGMVSADMGMTVLGAAFTLMPLLNIGCCGVSGCRVPASKQQAPDDEVTYEEVH